MRKSNLSTEYLKLPNSTFGNQDGIVIKRAPVAYGSSPLTDIDKTRLPDQEALKGMELAYREQYYSDNAIKNEGLQRILLMFGGCYAFSLGTIIMPLIPIDYGIIFSCIIAIVLSFSIFIIKRGQLKEILPYLFGIPSAYCILLFVGTLVKYRLLAAGIFSLISFVSFLKYGIKPIEFYRDWLYAHPRLTKATRDKPKGIKINFYSKVVLFAILLIASLGPIYYTGLSIISIYIISFVYFWKNSLQGDEIDQADQKKVKSIYKPIVDRIMRLNISYIFGLFFTYGMTTTGAPGIWIPSLTYKERKNIMWVIIASLFLSLTIGLNSFCPLDLFIDESQAIYETPYGWIVYSFIEINNDNILYLGLLPIMFIISITLPLLVIIGIYVCSLSEVELLRREIEEDEDSNFDRDDRTEWQWYFDRIRHSSHIAKTILDGTIKESDHFFMGIAHQAQYPVLLNEKILNEHCYIVGETGSGKTSLGIMPLLINLIRGKALSTEKKHHTPITGRMTLPPPLVIIDLKGDPALFNLMKYEAEKRRKELGITDENDPRYAFRFFTPEKNKASYSFNPFSNLKTDSRSDIQLCQLLLDSLNLNHGEGYGRSYFSRMNRRILYEAITMKNPEKPTSFIDIYNNIINRNETKKKEAQDSFELLSVFQCLSHYKMLYPNEDKNLEIHMPEVIDKHQTAYFWLPSVTESISVTEIAKLALFSLISAAVERQRMNKDFVQSYLVIDEFQRIASQNFKIILEQARSFGVSAILANQTQSDLVTNDIDLRPTISTNTRLKIFFSVTDPNEVNALSEISGDEVAILESWSEQVSEDPSKIQFSLSHTYNTSLKSRITRNDIIRTSDHPLDYIMKVSRGAGYTQFSGMPLIVRTTYPITKQDYDKYSCEEWPQDERLVKNEISPIEHDEEFSSKFKQTHDRMHERACS